jgi:hypothetical protein
MLVREEGEDGLYLIDATPRAWLEDGKSIRIVNAPTYFGRVNFEMESSISRGAISAVLELPDDRRAENLKKVFVRLRHPRKARIEGIAVNDKTWDKYDSSTGLIELDGKVRKQRIVVKY